MDSMCCAAGVGHEDPSDSDWFPPRKKARGMKRKSAVPTRIIKHVSWQNHGSALSWNRRFGVNSRNRPSQACDGFEEVCLVTFALLDS